MRMMGEERKRVLVCDPLEADVLDALKADFEVEFIDGPSEDELCEKITDADAVIVRNRTKITRRVLDSATCLKAIGRPGVGLDNIDTERAKELGILVFNSPEASTQAVAEYVCGGMFAIARKLHFADRKMREGVWAKKQCKGINLEGKTLGIIGFGRIGQRVAKFCKAIGMRVLAYDAFANEKLRETANGLGVELNHSLETVLETSDFVTLHVPLTEETRHMICAESINKMKDGAIIVNASRGGVIDEDALFAALASGKLGGAVLDVFENEPYTGRLLELDNVLLTPHIGGSTTETQKAAGRIILEKLKHALQ